MTTKLALIYGFAEDKHKLVRSEMLITSFYGGDERGRCLQFYIDENPYSFTDTYFAGHSTVQLSRKAVKTLLLVLFRWLIKYKED